MHGRGSARYRTLIAMGPILLVYFSNFYSIVRPNLAIIDLLTQEKALHERILNHAHTTLIHAVVGCSFTSSFSCLSKVD
jgi:hypothetical protein